MPARRRRRGLRVGDGPEGRAAGAGGRPWRAARSPCSAHSPALGCVPQRGTAGHVLPALPIIPPRRVERPGLPRACWLPAPWFRLAPAFSIGVSQKRAVVSACAWPFAYVCMSKGVCTSFHSPPSLSLSLLLLLLLLLCTPRHVLSTVCVETPSAPLITRARELELGLELASSGIVDAPLYPLQS